mmetsp:Transcript_4632/g.8803  ORF Transcript_4632/g.8803 Transcript_4632/m.8803 type:complete len:123 (+) Transcript_4632:27-395(+)
MARGPPGSLWWQVGASSGAIAVILGAFGAHALKAKVDPQMLEVWETANRYHFFHSLAMMLVPMTPAPKVASPRSGWIFATGIILFSGSLYAMVLTGNRKLGAITPIGGLCLIGGWVALGLKY